MTEFPIGKNGQKIGNFICDFPITIFNVKCALNIMGKTNFPMPLIINYSLLIIN